MSLRTCSLGLLMYHTVIAATCEANSFTVTTCSLFCSNSHVFAIAKMRNYSLKDESASEGGSHRLWRRGLDERRRITSRSAQSLLIECAPAILAQGCGQRRQPVGNFVVAVLRRLPLGCEVVDDLGEHLRHCRACLILGHTQSGRQVADRR
jgi:hypothetical protein